MKLTKVVATPGKQTEVLPRALQRFAHVRTASQLNPGVFCGPRELGAGFAGTAGRSGGDCP